MGLPGKERQRKYVEKRRAEGKRSVTILISHVTKDILDSERAVSGETFSSIIEKALLVYRGHRKPVKGEKTGKIPADKGEEKAERLGEQGTFEF
ncbi:MAG: hypothetical protein JXO48_10990 [Deltaproteobacteria bacterium]|nr:hypothetical protein [Deltaproteobacteria bacterium]